MAVIANKYGVAFFHIPKTGGTWLRHILKINNIETTYYAIDKRYPTKCSSILIKPNEIHHLPNLPNKKFKKVITIIRNPIDWYISFYTFRTNNRKYTWNKNRLFDKWTKAKTFEEFIDKVIDRFPKGFLNDLYKEYVEKSTDVFKLEKLNKDINNLFNNKLKLTEKINVSLMRPDIHKNQLLKIKEYEKEVFKTYYGGEYEKI